jgi:hypothetical protein
MFYLNACSVSMSRPFFYIAVAVGVAVDGANDAYKAVVIEPNGGVRSVHPHWNERSLLLELDPFQGVRRQSASSENDLAPMSSQTSTVKSSWYDDYRKCRDAHGGIAECLPSWLTVLVCAAPATLLVIVATWIGKIIDNPVPRGDREQLEAALLLRQANIQKLVDGLSEERAADWTAEAASRDELLRDRVQRGMGDTLEFADRIRSELDEGVNFAKEAAQEYSQKAREQAAASLVVARKIPDVLAGEMIGIKERVKAYAQQEKLNLADKVSTVMQVLEAMPDSELNAFDSATCLAQMMSQTSFDSTNTGESEGSVRFAPTSVCETETLPDVAFPPLPMIVAASFVPMKLRSLHNTATWDLVYHTGTLFSGFVVIWLSLSSKCHITTFNSWLKSMFFAQLLCIPSAFFVRRWSRVALDELEKDKIELAENSDMQGVADSVPGVGLAQQLQDFRQVSRGLLPWMRALYNYDDITSSIAYKFKQTSDILMMLIGAQILYFCVWYLPGYKRYCGDDVVLAFCTVYSVYYCLTFSISVVKMGWWAFALSAHFGFTFIPSVVIKVARRLDRDSPMPLFQTLAQSFVLRSGSSLLSFEEDVHGAEIDRLKASKDNSTESIKAVRKRLHIIEGLQLDPEVKRLDTMDDVTAHLKETLEQIEPIAALASSAVADSIEEAAEQAQALAAAAEEASRDAAEAVRVGALGKYEEAKNRAEDLAQRAQVLASAAGETVGSVAYAAGGAMQDHIAEATGAKLLVTIVRATGLVSQHAAGDHFFCVCAVDDSELQADNVCQTSEATTTEPVWEQTLALDWRIGEPLVITIYGRSVANTREVGRVVMHSMDFFPSGWSGPLSIEGVPEAELEIHIEPAASLLMRQAHARQSTKDAASAAVAAARAAAQAHSAHAVDSVLEATGLDFHTVLSSASQDTRV